MGKTKDYTDEQERIARYAKAMGHPARMAILQFLAGRETCFFGDIHEELPIATLEGIKGSRIDTGRNRGTESEILYQPDQLGGSQTIIFSFFLSL